MHSVADLTRQTARDSVLAMPVQERIALALRLGDDDRRIVESTQQVDSVTAVRQISRQRQRGRQRSASAEGTGG